MSELNNWLLDQEDRDWEGAKEQRKDSNRSKAAVLASLGLAASLGTVAANGSEAKAEEEQIAHNLLLCTYIDQNNGLAGTVINDPTSNQDQVFPPDPYDMANILDSGTAQKVYKGYILKPFGEWRVYKRVNGKDVQVGVLNGMNGKVIGTISDSGVTAATGGNFYKITDTGTTLVSELVGPSPLIGGHALAAGFVFANYLDAQNKECLGAMSEEDILNCTDGNVPVATTIQLPIAPSNKFSSGMDYDKSTGEFVIAINEGVITLDLTPFLDENGKLPYDFSLSDADFGQFVDFGLSTTGTSASNGHQYFILSGGAGVITRTPPQIASGEFTIIDKNQLGSGGKIKSAYELTTGGIYIIFDGGQPPVVLNEDGTINMDPGDVTPYIKKCFVVPLEEQAMFAPVADPCEGIICSPPVEQCKESTGCDPVTGDCGEQNKPNETACNADSNACTVGDACADGQCAAGTPKICAEPQEQCKQSAGCDQGTGNCLVINKTNGVSCDDGNLGTENDKCASGVCEGTTVAKPDPKPEVVELGPESGDGSDVAEQEDAVEQIEEIVVEQIEEIVESEVSEAEEDEDIIEISSDEVGTDDTADADPEITPDESGGDQADAQPEAQEEDAADVGADPSDDASEDDTISTDKKAPGCGCNTGGGAPDTANGNLLLALGLALAGTVARLREKFAAVFAPRK